MTNKQGEFIWYELMTSDLDGARAFYEPVVGWTIGGKSDMPGMDYRMIAAQDAMVGGAMQIDDDMAAHGARPMWVGYIGVDNVDASVASIEAAGGSITMPAWDIPGIGRLAMIADPQGAPFYVMRGASDESSTVFAPETLGHCAWNELATTDLEAANAFYMGQFGWTNKERMPMGPMGDYCFLDAGEIRIGASMKGEGPPLWQPYFRVSSIAKAIEAVTTLGGQIINGPHEVPGGLTIIIGIDPQGARFALAGGA